MRHINYFIALVVLCICAAGCADNADARLNAVVPHPAKMELVDNGAFLLDGSAAVVYDTECAVNSASFLKNYIKEHYGIELGKSGLKKIELKIAADSSAVKGAYALRVAPRKITVEGKNEEGLFYGVQTLLQLLPVVDMEESIGKKKLAIPLVEIEDAPAFQYRGMHLDVARHFMPVEFIKEYIDYLAMHKINHFHWHLTDDQGWRIESRKHPRLNEVGSYRDATFTPEQG